MRSGNLRPCSTSIVSTVSAVGPHRRPCPRPCLRRSPACPSPRLREPDRRCRARRVGPPSALCCSSRALGRPRAALLRDGDRAPKVRKTGRWVDRAVVVEGAGRVQSQLIRAPGRAASIGAPACWGTERATVPDADVAPGGVRGGPLVSPLDRRAHLDAHRGRREREVLNDDRRGGPARHPAAHRHGEPRSRGELAGGAKQDEGVQYRGAAHERLRPIHTRSQVRCSPERGSLPRLAHVKAWEQHRRDCPRKSLRGHRRVTVWGAHLSRPRHPTRTAPSCPVRRDSRAHRSKFALFLPLLPAGRLTLLRAGRPHATSSKKGSSDRNRGPLVRWGPPCGPGVAARLAVRQASRLGTGRPVTSEPKGSLDGRRRPLVLAPTCRSALATRTPPPHIPHTAA